MKLADFNIHTWEGRGKALEAFFLVVLGCTGRGKGKIGAVRWLIVGRWGDLHQLKSPAGFFAATVVWIITLESEKRRVYTLSCYTVLRCQG